MESVRFPLVFRAVTVARVDPLTPRMKRVVVTGPELSGFQSLGPTDHVKLFFPTDGPESLSIPGHGPEDAPRSPARDFTPRAYDEAANELTLDFVVHDRGVATDWVTTAGPGSVLGIAGPRGSRIVPQDFDWVVLAGDETAIPSISRWIERLPGSTRITAYIEVDSEADQIPLPEHPQLSFFWLNRGDSENPATLELDALRAGGKPESGKGYAWAGGETETLRAIRRLFRDEWGLPAGSYGISGHWRRGVADWDHHEEIPE